LRSLPAPANQPAVTLSAGGLGKRTFNYFHSTLPNGASQLTIPVPCSVQNLRGLLIGLRKTTDVVNGSWKAGSNLAPLKYTNAFVGAGINNLAVTIDGTQYPIKPIDTTNAVEVVGHLEKFWGNLDRLGSWFDTVFTSATDSKIYYAISFAADDNGVSGTSLVTKSGNITITSTCSAPADLDVDVFLVSDRFIRIDQAGGIAVTK